jgi:RNA polymerase sigma-70 factor (ECF subfamily)
VDERPQPGTVAHDRKLRRRFDVSREEREEVARRFLAAREDGDTDSLIELAPDGTVYGDGGGKAPMAMPLVCAEHIAKALIGWGRKAFELELVYRPALVNGDPGLVVEDADGRAVWVSAFEIADGAVVAVRSILNPAVHEPRPR